MTRSRLLRFALATAFASAFAVASLAQGGLQGPPAGGPGQGRQGGPGFGGPGGMQMRRGGMQSGMMLVQMKSVQKELNLSATQIEQISKLGPMGGPGGPRGGIGGPPPQGQGGQRQGPPQGQGGQRGGFQGGPPQGGPDRQGPGGNGPMEQIAKILNDGQFKRLNQLMVQFDAPMTMLDPRHGEALELSDEQRQAIQKIVQENLPPMRGPGFGGPGGPPPGGPGGQAGAGGGAQGRSQQPGAGRPEPMDWAEMIAKKSAATKAALKVLNASQRESWFRLTGAEFTKWEQPQRPRIGE